MNEVVTEAWLMREFTTRAKACLLSVDCLGAGSLNSEICVIGEAVNEHEAAMKMPMVGGRGRLLWDILRKFEISRIDCYVTNVVKKQTSSSKSNCIQ